MAQQKLQKTKAINIEKTLLGQWRGMGTSIYYVTLVLRYSAYNRNTIISKYYVEF